MKDEVNGRFARCFSDRTLHPHATREAPIFFILHPSAFILCLQSFPCASLALL
jgi:hypothetical protein